MKPILVFENVTKTYPPKVEALIDVTFSVYEGEFVFIVGPSGAGKSTITKLALLEELPSKGHIMFDGKSIDKMKSSESYKIRRNIGVVFQNFRLLQNRTVFENLAFVLEILGMSDKDIKDQVMYSLDLVGLTAKAGFFPGQLSGGEQQRATIARAVVSQPKLLIADEPTGNLDEKNTWDVIQLLNKINNWGTTVIVATHDKEVVDSLQRRVIALEAGRLVRDSAGGYYKNELKVKPVGEILPEGVSSLEPSKDIVKTDNQKKK
jgi:cell division transport system ATP-binding protein